MFADITTQVDINQTKNALQTLGESVFDWHSLFVLVLCVTSALIVGSTVALLIRRLTRSIARSADATTDLGMVNRLRRLETILIISIAIIRIFLMVTAVYVWWVATHPNTAKPSSIIGAGALTALIFGGAITPLLRDFSFGAGMMAERWFGVGDLISIDFPKVQGVVERITLRSTKIRGLNGEIIWVANQTMNGVRVTQKGVHRTAIEIFTNDSKAAETMVRNVNNLLPGGYSLLVAPLEVVDISLRDENVWHLTAIGETAPGREWILEKTAIEIFKKLDGQAKKPILIVDPVARYADPDMEKQLARAVKNARKQRRAPRYHKVIKDDRSQKNSARNDG